MTLTGHAADDPPQVRHASRIWRPIRRVLRAASQNAQFGNSDDKIRQANMLVWNQYRKRVLAGVGDIGRMSPDMVKGYLTRTNQGLRGCRCRTSTRRRANELGEPHE
jgi:hypothetical protein